MFNNCIQVILYYTYDLREFCTVRVNKSLIKITNSRLVIKNKLVLKFKNCISFVNCIFVSLFLNIIVIVINYYYLLAFYIMSKKSTIRVLTMFPQISKRICKYACISINIYVYENGLFAFIFRKIIKFIIKLLAIKIFD